MNSIVAPNPSDSAQFSWASRYSEIIDLYKSGSLSEVVGRALASTRDYPSVYEFWELLGAASRNVTAETATSHSNLAVALPIRAVRRAPRARPWG